MNNSNKDIYYKKYLKYKMKYINLQNSLGGTLSQKRRWLDLWKIDENIFFNNLYYKITNIKNNILKLEAIPITSSSESDSPGPDIVVINFENRDLIRPQYQRKFYLVALSSPNIDIIKKYSTEGKVFVKTDEKSIDIANVKVYDGSLDKLVSDYNLTYKDSITLIYDDDKEKEIAEKAKDLFIDIKFKKL